MQNFDYSTLKLNSPHETNLTKGINTLTDLYELSNMNWLGSAQNVFSFETYAESKFVRKIIQFYMHYMHQPHEHENFLSVQIMFNMNVILKG